MSIKQRLVGAVVLVAAAVVFLPMIFDGPRPNDGGTRTVDLALPASEPAVQVDIDSGESVATGTAASGAPTAAEAKPGADTVQTPPATKAPTAGAATQPDQAIARSQPKSAATPKPEPVGESPLASKAGWAVQAGSFSDPDHAQALAKRLQKKGLSAFVQRYSGAGRTLYRVRVGPYPERIDAERQAPAVAAAAGGPTKVVPTP